MRGIESVLSTFTSTLRGEILGYGSGQCLVEYQYDSFSY